MLIFLISIPCWVFVGGACAYRVLIEENKNILFKIGFFLTLLYPFFLPFLLNGVDNPLMM